MENQPTFLFHIPPRRREKLPAGAGAFAKFGLNLGQPGLCWDHFVFKQLHVCRELSGIKGRSHHASS